MALLLSTTAKTLSPKLFFYSSGSFTENPVPISRLFTGLNLNFSKNTRNRFPVTSLAVKKQSISRTKEKNDGKIVSSKGKVPVLSEGRDADEKYGPVCPGCGVFMQDKDPNLPGFYKEKKVVEKVVVEDYGDLGFEDEIDDFSDDEVQEYWDQIDGKLEEYDSDDEEEDEFDWNSDDWEDKLEEVYDSKLDSFAPAGVGYGNVTEETIEKGKRKRLSKTERKQIAREANKVKDEVTVCARCHSLRNYGQVKNESSENLIPDFDFERLVATRFVKPTGKDGATVVVMVVDCVDFDGSFPKRAAKSLFKLLEGAQNDPKMSKKMPKLVLVGTKVDLLPSQISPTRLEKWVRQRSKAGGAPKLNGVYMVSAHKDLGVKNLLAFVKQLAGPRGNVWVIGAQNAGKSTLINAFTKKEAAEVTRLTEAPLPGTTLGILRISGILSAKAKMYDTPGLLHPYLMSMRLNREEQKMVEIRKELKPRTYRIKVGQTIHVGGLMRLDLNHASVETIYVTIWASPNLSLHSGKIENAEEIWNKHVGTRLQPPIGNERVPELGKWEDREMKVSGNSWVVNSVDIAAAGLGWFSIGLKGEARLTLWTYDGIEITTREPLVLDRAPVIERSGFWLPNTIGKQTKSEAKKKKSKDSLLEVSS